MRTFVIFITGALCVADTAFMTRSGLRTWMTAFGGCLMITAVVVAIAG